MLFQIFILAIVFISQMSYSQDRPIVSYVDLGIGDSPNFPDKEPEGDIKPVNGINVKSKALQDFLNSTNNNDSSTQDKRPPLLLASNGLNPTRQRRVEACDAITLLSRSGTVLTVCFPR